MKGEDRLKQPKFITVNEAAKRASVHDSFIRKMMRDGRIAGQKVTNRMWLVDEKSFEKWAMTPRKRGNPNWLKKTK